MTERISEPMGVLLIVSGGKLLASRRNMII